MQNTHFTILDTGKRVQGFLDAQVAVVGPLVPAALRAQLDDGVSKIAAFQAQQGVNESAAKGETTKQQLLRDDLYSRFLHPIEGTAKKQLKGTTEQASLIVPSTFRNSNKRLAKASEAADAAAKHEQLFLDNGLPADFIAQLRAGIAQINASIAARGQQLTDKAAATAGLVAANKALRGTIDTLNRALTPVLKANPALLAGWTASKRVKQLVVTPLPGGSVGASAAPDQSPSAETAAPSTPATSPAPAAPASTSGAA